MDKVTIHERRSAQVPEQLTKHKVDALLILNDEESQRANTRWLTGFSGSRSFSLLSPDSMLLITDSRYAIQARKERKSPWQIRVLSPEERPSDLMKALPLQTIGVIGQHITVAQFRKLRKDLRPMRLKTLPNILSPLQEIKDDLDLHCIKQAIAGIEQALAHILEHSLKPGVSELEVERQLSMALPLNAELAFAIIASGPNSAIPHYNAKEANPARILKKGDIVKLDVGCRINDYHSDITRVVVIGKASPEQKRMHKALLEAQTAAIYCYQSDMPVKRADEEARRILKAYGYDHINGEDIIYKHGLGHGLGLQVHENPTVHSLSKGKFKVGQLVTCEPGLYREGWGGMRIEDDVLITPSGNEVLTKFPRDLIEI